MLQHQHITLEGEPLIRNDAISPVVAAIFIVYVKPGPTSRHQDVHTVCDNITLTFCFYRTLEVRNVLFRCTEQNDGIAQQSRERFVNN